MTSSGTRWGVHRASVLGQAVGADTGRHRLDLGALDFTEPGSSGWRVLDFRWSRWSRWNGAPWQPDRQLWSAVLPVLASTLRAAAVYTILLVLGAGLAASAAVRSRARLQ